MQQWVQGGFKILQSNSMSHKTNASSTWIGFVHYIVHSLFFVILGVLGFLFIIIKYFPGGLSSFFEMSPEQMDIMTEAPVFVFFNYVIATISIAVGTLLSSWVMNSWYEISNARAVASTTVTVSVGIYILITFVFSGDPVVFMDVFMYGVYTVITYFVTLWCLNEDK